MILATLSTIGFILSSYAYYIEWKHGHKPDYRAVCDISGKASCTRAFTGEYGRLLGIPNSIVGIIAYAALFVLALLGLNVVIFYLSAGACLASVFLSYLLFKERNLCIVCASIAIVNVLLLAFSIRAL